MKAFFLFGLLFVFSSISAQIRVTKYYDANWMETPKEKATFYADFIKNGEYYNCTSYWSKTNILRGKSIYPDTVMQFPVGLQILYFKNGHIEDSFFLKIKT